MQHSGDISRKIASLPPEARVRLEQLVSAAGETSTPASQPHPVRRAGDRVPLSFAQQRLWFMEQGEERAVRRNDGFLLLIRGEVDLTAMTRSIEEIIRGHEILRTSYAVDEDGPHQVVGAPWAPTIDEIALPEAAADRADPVLVEAFRRQMERPLDLAQGRPLRAVLYRLGPGRSVLGVILAHIVRDLWSLAVFARELNALYAGFLPGRTPVALSELTLQYGDYAVRQREAMNERRLALGLDRRVELGVAVELAAIFDHRGTRPRVRGVTALESISS